MTSKALRRRRAQTPSIAEPVNDTLKQAIKELNDAQSSETDLTQPGVPSIPTSFSSLSDHELFELRDQLESSQSANIAALKQWEEYGRHLQAALDAALLLSSLKSEPETKKRRRNSTLPEFTLGSSVAYRFTKKPPPDDEWIQCEVIKVIQEGVVYEVRDPEPDETSNSGHIYKANVKDLLLIPSVHSSLPTYAPGTSVIAQYPETTTFYRAELVSTRGPKCRLVFYGEEEDRKETEVDRNLVLRPETK